MATPQDAFNQLKELVIRDLRKSPNKDKPFIVSTGISLTLTQIANDIEADTIEGSEFLAGMIALTADLIARGKQQL